MLEFFIDVALECVRLSNFNSFMAIAAATSMTPVARLRKALAKIPAHKMVDVEVGWGHGAPPPPAYDSCHP